MSNDLPSQNAKVDALISQLSDDLEPVRLVFSPLLRALPCIVIAILYVGGLCHFWGMRFDLQDKMIDDIFIFEIVLVSFMGVSTLISAAYLTLPDGIERKPWLPVIPIVLFSVFTVWNIIQIIFNITAMPKMELHHCASDGLFIAALPLFGLIVLMRMGASTKPVLMAVMTSLSIGAIGWIGLRLTCPIDEIDHVFLYHYMPFLIVGFLLSLLARKIYRW